MKIFSSIGNYVSLMRYVFMKPQKQSIYMRQTILEIEKIGLNSLWIVFIISVFFGAVITLQTAINMDNPLLPNYLIGLGTRDSIILEFSSTVLSLILAGKVGSNIASEIGTMKVTEQVDALEIMGVNSASYLIAPKIFAALLVFPILTLLTIIFGIMGGWLSGILSGQVSTTEYVYGIQYQFRPFFLYYTLVKSVVFGFIITSISSYYGYITEGGALDVGKASTNAVVNSSVVILIFNVIITQLLLI